MQEEESNKELNEEFGNQETITKVTGMYKDWFLDYASYVILERAVPAIKDGFKPVLLDIQCNTILMAMLQLPMRWCKLVKKNY